MYAIVRSDVAMPPGKMVAQAGHAFLEAYLASDPERAHDYRSTSVGTKVVLTGSLLQLQNAAFECERLGIPHSLIEDSGHVCPPDFDGSPVVTALGIGIDPEAGRVTKRFQLMGDAR